MPHAPVSNTECANVGVHVCKLRVLRDAMSAVQLNRVINHFECHERSSHLRTVVNNTA